MDPKNLKQTVLVLAVLLPALTVCQSRGELYKGETTQSQSNGYLKSRFAHQGQGPSLPFLQPQPQPQHYQQQQQSQSYTNPPEYYAPQPQYPQYQSAPQYNTQPLYVQRPQSNYNNNQPAYVAPAPASNNPTSPPRNQSPQNYYNVQTQQKPNQNIDSRFASDESVSQTPSHAAEDFTSRAPNANKSPRVPVVTRKPPLLVADRFDDRGSSAFKKTLSFDKVLSASMEVFALELMAEFIDSSKGDNFMISPFSIYHMLVLIAEGAQGNTFNEINDKLKLETLERTRDFQQYLNVALKQNTADVFLKKFALLITDVARPIKTEYENRIEKVYDSDAISVNFIDVDKTLQDINGLVSNLTLGLIQETIKREDLFKAQLILISGLVFKGQWMNVFNKTFTKREPFYDTNGKQTGEVNMMFQRGPFAYSPVAELGCHVLELPYADSPQSRNDLPSTGLSMILVLPRKGLSLDEAIRNVYVHGMAKIYRELRNSKEEYGDDEVEVHLPRFETTSSFNMHDTLKDLGIKDAFDQSRADLSGIHNQYFVSAMIHNTKIAVDEEGTSAAAVTTSIFANKATPPKFHANKPFLYFIVDKVTNIILFSGQQASPTLF